MNSFTIIPHVGEGFWSLDLLLNLLWKSSLLWLLIKFITVSFSARQAQWIWRFGLFGLLVIFLLCSSSIWEIQSGSPLATSVPIQVEIHDSSPPHSSPLRDDRQSPPLSQYSTFSPQWDSLLMGIWFAGFLIIIVKAILEYLVLRNAERNAQDFDLSRQAFKWEKIVQQTGLSRSPRILLSQTMSIPITFGWQHPIILLPQQAINWDDERIRQVLLHELIHIKRADYFFNILSVGVKGLYWFNPISWIQIEQFRLTREWACDEQLLAMGINKFSYAENLVAIAKLSQSAPLRQLPPTFAKSHSLVTRVKRVLNPPPQVSKGTGFQLMALTAVVLLSLFSLSLNLRTINKKPYSKAANRQALEHLRSVDTAQKIVGLDQLGQWGRRNSFTYIKPLVLDNNPETRKKALWAVQQIGCLPAFHLISQQLQDDNDEIQQYASDLLATYPSAKLQAYLLDYLGKPSMKGWFIQHFQQIELLGQTEQLAHHLGGGNALLQSQIQQQLESLQGEETLTQLQQLLKE